MFLRNLYVVLFPKVEEPPEIDKHSPTLLLVSYLVFSILRKASCRDKKSNITV